MFILLNTFLLMNRYAQCIRMELNSRATSTKRDERMALKVKHLKEVGSTNDYALRLINDEKLDHDVAIIADIQTNGRGRLNGRFWNSPLGNFYCSYIINLQNLCVPDNATNLLTFSIINALYQYLIKITKSDKIKLKQPNDILVNNKKLAGVLTEVSYPYAIVGIGINLVNSPIERATNLKSEFKLLVNPMDLAENFYEFLMYELNKCFLI